MALSHDSIYMNKVVTVPDLRTKGDT